MKPLQLTPFIQSKAYCGPASLKILLSYFGKTYSEKTLAKLSGATRKNGTEHEGLIKAIKKLGGHVHAKTNGSISELRHLVLKKRLPVLVGWYSTHGIPGDHYSVVYHLSKNYIYLMDPERGQCYHKMSIKKFVHYWYDFVGPKNRAVKQWFMVVWF